MTMDWKTVLGFTVMFHLVVYALRKEWILRLDTRKLNGPLNAIGTHPIRKYFRVWFRAGTYATITLGFPFTLFLFLRTIFYAFFPSIVAVAIAVTPASFMPDSSSGSSLHEPLELHHEQLSPYPDADIGIQDPVNDSDDATSAGGHGYLSIQPILPGWNLPITHLPYYLIAILISVVIHELGHAIASAAHKVPIQSVGVSIFGPLIPAAHVELNSIQLRETPIRKQLDILTAGVWMNLYLAIITYLVVPKMLPALLWPTHSMGTGLTVTGVWPSSGIGGPGGLDVGDVIIGIENCPVKDLDSWYTCLEKIWQSDPVGYCVNDEALVKFANNSEGCCGSDDSPTHLCFLQMDTTNSLPPHPSSLDKPNASLPSSSNPNVTTGGGKEEAASDSSDSSVTLHGGNTNNQTTMSYCLPAQPVVAEASPPPDLSLSENMDEAEAGQASSSEFLGWKGRCHSPKYSCSSSKTSSLAEEEKETEGTPVASGGDEVKVINESSQSHCFLPRLVHNVERFRIVQIQRKQQFVKTPVLFVGNVMDLYNGMRNSEYVPRSWFLSSFFGFSSFSKLPEKLETVLLLTAGLSAGLAVVNMLPIYGLDGYHIVDAMARAYFTKKWEPRKISSLVQVISWISLAIALMTVFCSLAQAL